MNRNQEDVVMCPQCDHMQVEINLAEGDKFAWKCMRCEAIVEDGKLHALQAQARFCWPRRGGGNVCTGFGGKAGEVHHKVY